MESSENLSDFDQRATSKIFSSFRPKKEKNQKTSPGSKSIFSTLVLANYEDRVYLDPNINIDSITLNSHKVKKTVLKNVLQNEKQKPGNHTISTVKEDENGQSVSPQSESIRLNIELKLNPHIYEIYGDLLYIILHKLNKQIDDDRPEINQKSAFLYIQDVFGISTDKHEQLLKKVERKYSPETEVTSCDEPEMQNFILISPKLEHNDILEAHCTLLKIFLKHELEMSSSPHYHWMGKFSFLPSSLLEAHADHCFLDELSVAFCKWSAYCEIHQQHFLNFKVFNDLLNHIVEEYRDDEKLSTLQSKTTKMLIPACFSLANNAVNNIKTINERRCDKLKSDNEEHTKVFWEATNQLYDSFLKCVGGIHYETDDGIFQIMNLKGMFEITKRIEKILVSHDCEQINFTSGVKLILAKSAKKHFDENLSYKKIHSTLDEIRLCELIRVIKFATSHLKKVTEDFIHLFEAYFDFSFSEHLYVIYDKILAELIKPIVADISETREGNIDNFANAKNERKNSIAFKLFELYNELKNFSDSAMELHPNVVFHTKCYFEWFSAGIDKLCQVSVFSALSRIEKAIEIDNFKPELKDAKHSSSALDTLQILYSVKGFWEKLKWPEQHREEEIARKVAADVCRFAIIYCEKFCEKVENSESMKNVGIFKVPSEMCIAIVNFNYLSKNIQTLIDEIIKGKVSNQTSVQKIVDNMLDFMKQVAEKLIQSTLLKTEPTTYKLILEAAEKSTEDHNERLLFYLDDVLTTLSDELEGSQFYSAKSFLWNLTIDTLFKIVQHSIQNGKNPVYFSNLRNILNVLKDLFQFTEHFEETERLKEIDRILENYGLNTSRLIHQYYKDRYEMQLEIQKYPHSPKGMLTIICSFNENILNLTVLNAVNLIPIGPNRKCDSFVKISVIPERYFPSIPSLKTKTQHNTHFPLFDETFQILLTNEQRTIEDAVLYFLVKDKYLLGSNECIAEAFLQFKDVPNEEKRICLALTRLQNDEIHSLKAIQHRSQLGDKEAKEFLSKLKSKTLLSPKRLKIPVTEL